MVPSNYIFYWPSGAGYMALIEGDPHFAFDPLDFLDRAHAIWPERLVTIVGSY